MNKTIKLENPRQVMGALLGGLKLVWSGYGDDESGDCYIYLSESGYLCEEDGAGLKANRIDLTFRGNNPNWRILL
jgi:hypothetical protein